MAAAWRIDRARVWALGHSNGAAMAYRLACAAADVFSAAVAISGAVVPPEYGGSPGHTSHG